MHTEYCNLQMNKVGSVTKEARGLLVAKDGEQRGRRKREGTERQTDTGGRGMASQTMLRFFCRPGHRIRHKQSLHCSLALLVAFAFFLETPHLGLRDVAEPVTYLL